MTTTDETPDEQVETKRDPIPVVEKIPSKKPKYFVAGTTFYAQMDDGWELAAPVKLSTRNVKKLRESDDGADELDQLVKLFEILGDAETVEKLLDADFVDATETALRYFQAWEEKNEARLGELSRS
jgi:hypothetical protein